MDFDSEKILKLALMVRIADNIGVLRSSPSMDGSV